MFEVSKSIKPLMSRTNTALTANERAGISKKYAAKPARKAKTIPTIRKPDIKLKSFFDTKAKKDIVKNIAPVPVIAIATNSVPLEKAVVYALIIGPKVRPINPVKAKTPKMPITEF
jgi:hypothetical protein